MNSFWSGFRAGSGTSGQCVPRNPTTKPSGRSRNSLKRNAELLWTTRLWRKSPRTRPWLFTEARSVPQRLWKTTSGLAVRSPEAVEDHVRLGGEKLRDLGRQVALEELWPEGLDHLDVGLELAEGADEDLPRVPPPRVVLVEAGHRLHIGLGGQEIAGRADPVDARVGGGAEHILVLRLLEDPGGPAVEGDGGDRELLGDGGHGHAIGARDVADDQVHLLVRREAPDLGDALVTGPGLVGENRHELRPADAALVVDLLDPGIRGLLRWDTEGARGRPGEQRHDADTELFRRAGDLGGGRLGRCGWRQDGDQGQHAQRDHARETLLHHALPMIGRLGPPEG